MRSDTDLVRWVVTPCLALVGGVTASLVLGDPPVGVAVILALVLGVVVSLVDWRSELAADGAAEPPLPGFREVPPRPPSGLYGRVTSPGPVRPSVPSHSRPDGSQNKWWDGDGSFAAAEPSMPPDRPALAQSLPDLSSYMPRAKRVGRIPQCPRCGGFTITIGHRENRHAFTCGACGKRWQWAPGSPWPPVRVDPRVRR